MAATVTIDLARVRSNAAAVRSAVGAGVRVYATVKADAYGLGASAVAAALADLVDGWYVFRAAEAVEADLRRFGLDAIALLPPDDPADDSPEFYRHHGIRPAVWDVDRTAKLKDARPVLSVDCGMRRLACPADRVDAVLDAANGTVDEAMTHASRPAQARRLVDLLGGRGLRLHAAGSGLLGDPSCHLDAVRPGLALYRGAARVTAPLVEVHPGDGPAGYGQFASTGHGVALVGYSNGLRPGVCLLNGTRRRVVEVGMQSCYVEATAGDAVGDEVVLLGDGLSEAEVAAAWGVGEHEVLVRLAWAGARRHVGG